MRLCRLETETHDASPWAQLGMAAVQPNTLCRNPFAAKSQHLAAPEFSRTQRMPCARFLPSSAAGACHAAKAVSQRYWEWVTGAVHSRASSVGARATCRGGGGARGRGSAGHRGANAAASRRPPTRLPAPGSFTPQHCAPQSRGCTASPHLTLPAPPSSQRRHSLLACVAMCCLHHEDASLCTDAPARPP